MPKIDRRLMEASFFLYRKNPKHPEKYEGPFGTGCIVARPAGHPNGAYHYYAVSNRHVVHNYGASIIRINMRDGRVRHIEKAADVGWFFVGDKDDLSIADISDDLNVDTDAVSGIPESGFATEKFISDYEIGVGDELFMLGMFVDQYGGDLNVPSGRFGNLSLLASKDAPVENDYGNRRPSHIGDMRSRTGYSGSPVFCYRNFGSDLKAAVNQAVALDPRQHFLKFLGVHCGQFWDTIEFRKANAKKVERLGDPIVEGDRIQIQSAMTIIVPAWEVTNLLEHGLLQQARHEREARGTGGAGKWARIPRAELTGR